MGTLYRQYRPDTFGEIVGQAHVTDTLARAVTKERLTHAYLFYGPRGTGKTTTARVLAKRVNCMTPRKAEPCGTCASCEALKAGRHLDVVEIDAASNRGIDDVRSLRDHLASAPVLGTYKVYIIDEVHMLTNEAAAALLKTLEEPTEHVIFILATTELHKVLPTILSRCQVYRFRRASRQELVQRLTTVLKREKRQANEDVLAFIADRADGCYRDAESLLGQLLTLQPKKLIRERAFDLLGLPDPGLMEQFLTSLVRGESAPALAAAEEAWEGGVDPEQFLREAVRVGRDVAIDLAAERGAESPIAREPGAAERLPELLRVLLQAIGDLAYVPQPLVAVQLAVLMVCSRKGEIEQEAAGKRPQAAATPAAAVSAKASSKPPQPSRSAPQPKEQQRAPRKASPTVSVEAVKKVWVQAIDAVKGDNPVASTFLRAVEPQAVTDDVVSIRAQYALHQTFFETPKNKRRIEAVLSELVGFPLKVKVFLDEAGTQEKATVAERKAQRGEEFYQTVQEVFK